jgi:hypothetical protein
MYEYHESDRYSHLRDAARHDATRADRPDARGHLAASVALLKRENENRFSTLSAPFD